jgi:hypothetical protein
MKFCPVVPEICRGHVHVAKKERRIIIIIIIIRNGAKTISLQTQPLFRIFLCFGFLEFRANKSESNLHCITRFHIILTLKVVEDIECPQEKCFFLIRNNNKNHILQLKKNPIVSVKFVTDLQQVRWFSLGSPVSSTDKTNCHDIADILLKVALNTITQFFSVGYYQKKGILTLDFS